MLVLHGEQGTAKSTLAKVLRSVVDPNETALRTEPRDERDLMIAATNAWCLTFDNLSHVPAWFSDGLCRLATGGGFATRELYSDAEEVLFNAQRPALLNGIEELATRGDILDRAILLYLPTIPKAQRQDETSFWRAFETARPRILGALLDAVSTALRELPAVTLCELPRMADFALWACAASAACDWRIATPAGDVTGADAFLHVYTHNQDAAHELALEASSVAQAVCQLAEAGVWSGTASLLLDTLSDQVGETLYLAGLQKLQNV